MKKIFALVLAVAMLSSMAMAAATTSGNMADGTTSVNPGKTLTAGWDDFTGITDLPVGEFTSANFTITKKTFTKGSNLVKSVAFNDDDEVIEIKMNSDYSLTRPGTDKADNLVIKDLEVKAKKTIAQKADKTKDAVMKNKSYAFDKDSINYGFKIGYNVTELTFDTDDIEYSEDGIVKFLKNKGTNTSYDIASYTGNDVYFEGRVYADDKIFTKVDSTVDTDQKAALKAYPDADLRFVNIVTNGLSSNNDIQVLADKDEFVYEMVDGKVVKSNLKWSEDDYAWVGKFRTNKNYVISDIELKAAAAADDVVVNPGTGANDVVGVAAALAIVSVVAAAAVSLKK